MNRERLPLDRVNAMDRVAFVAAFGGVYERSPWVAEAAWDSRPFADRDALERAMREAVERAGPERQLELLKRHPALGTRRELAGFSRDEQAGAGIQDADARSRAELAELNGAYERRFGHPFILAVRGATVGDILESCRRRTTADAAGEFAESLRQVFRIAGFRLADLV